MGPMILSHAMPCPKILTLAEVSFCRVEIWRSRRNSGPKHGTRFGVSALENRWDLVARPGSHIAIEHGPVEKVDLPINSMLIFHS